MIEYYDGFESWGKSFGDVDDKSVDIHQLCQYLLDRVLHYNINFLSDLGIPGFSLSDLVPLPDPVKQIIITQFVNELTGKINNALDLQKSDNSNTIAYTLASKAMNELTSWMQGSYSEEASIIASGTILDYGGDLLSNPRLLLAYLVSPGGIGYSLLIGTSPSNPGYFTKLISNAMEDFAVDVLGVPVTSSSSSSEDAFADSTGPSFSTKKSNMTSQVQAAGVPSGLSTATNSPANFTRYPGSGSKLPVVPIAIGIAALILLKG